MQNLILKTDSYKVSHYLQYPPRTESVYSYLESRGGMFNKIKFFGLQYIIKKFLVNNERYSLEFCERFFNDHFGTSLFNKSNWKGIDYLPLSIRAVPEGKEYDVLEPLVVVENTDPRFYWLTNYVETLLMQVWYPITVATYSRQIKKVILEALEKTGTPESIDFKLHDFGFRGVSSYESAGIGGMAHLTNFKGTDTLPAIDFAQEYYNAPVCGLSIPAAEHSTITSWGRKNESLAYKNMIEKFGDCPFYAVVSDSYDIFNACENIWGGELKDLVLNAKGTLVIRPDSGDPVDVILKCLSILERKFGATKNPKGYKVLHPKVRLIQGDGVDFDAIVKILIALSINEWSADNIAFGMGGSLLQKLNRDTQNFAFKCSAIKADGKWRDVYKDPVTDKNKRSKRGIVDESKMVEVFRDGKILKEYSWGDVFN